MNNNYLFRSKDYITLWTIGTLLNILRWADIILVSIVIYEITSSPLQVSYLIIIRFLPLILLGYVSGTISDNINRRIGFINGLLIMAILSLILLFITYYYNVSPLLLQCHVLVNGIFWAFEMSTRKSLIIDITPKILYSKSITIDSISTNVTRFIGPLLSALYFNNLNFINLLYVTSTIYLICGLICVIFTNKTKYPNKIYKDTSYYNIFKESIIYIRNNKLLLNVFLITIIFNLWAYPYISMLPVIGKDILNYSGQDISILASIEGFGSLLGVLIILIYNKYKFYNRYYVGGTILTLICSFLFCFTFNYASSLIILLISGIGSGFFGVMQNVLIALHSPNKVKGAMFGILTMCIGFASLGYLHIGLLSLWLGVKYAIVLISIEGLIVLILTIYLSPNLIKKN
jgi:MFS family permease|tara:strand:- start:263 stop:1471 length:1209 start_codon:yes stop_codon:yes gene_type:complete